MLLSCSIPRGIWRFQACLQWHLAACSMTSPYRQRVSSYIVHHHSLTFLICTFRYTSNATSTQSACVGYHLKLCHRPNEILSSKSSTSARLLSFYRNCCLHSQGISRRLWCVVLAVRRIWLCLSFEGVFKDRQEPKEEDIKVAFKGKTTT